MKNKICLLTLFTSLLFTFSCNNEQKEKELQLKEKELQLKEKELELKEREQNLKINPTQNIKIDPKNIAQQKFNNYIPKIETSKNAIVANNKIFIGDLNNDNLDDAVVWFLLTPAEGGNMFVGEGMSVYINTGKDMKVVSGFEPNYMFKIIKISNNRIKIAKQDYAENDQTGWPSIETIKYLMLSGNDIIESNSNN